MNINKLCLFVTCLTVGLKAYAQKQERPNILFIVADDMTWKHCGVYGCQELNTPNLDRLSSEGVTFHNAYTSAPSSTASRAAILTGKNAFELDEGIVLGGYLPVRFKSYVDYLEDAGYKVGCTGKGWGPGVLLGRKRNPAGYFYREHRQDPYPEFMKCEISDVDYAANFNNFLYERELSQPFCFWVGIHEPHKEYTYNGFAQKHGIDVENVTVPAFIPSTMDTKIEVAEYYAEIQHLDREVGRIYDILEKQGLLDNTLIVFTSDNGMPFARAKTNLYEYGIHMPLIVRWGDNTSKGLDVYDNVSLIDIAPTFMEAAGLDVPADMTGNSLLPLLNKKGKVFNSERSVFSCLECHGKTWIYPMRSIKKDNYLLIWNALPERKPLACDGGASIDVVLNDTIAYSKYYNLYYGRRASFELYDVEKDPCCLENLYELPKMKQIAEELQHELFIYLKKCNDPRVEGNFDDLVEYTPQFMLYSKERMFYSDADQGQRIPFDRIELMLVEDYKAKGYSDEYIEKMIARLRKNCLK